MEDSIMKQLELSGEQTLRLEELRRTLIEALAGDAAEAAVFPVARYDVGPNDICGAVYVHMCRKLYRRL